jgi:signal transduction histidine kinase
MKKGFTFMKRIKSRVALSFSTLFLIVAIPAIIYAFGQVQLFFEGMYLQQMRVAGLTAQAIVQENSGIPLDSLASHISLITTSNVFLISKNGEILARRYIAPVSDSSTILSFPILAPGTADADSLVRHKFIWVGITKYVQVQTELPGGIKLLQVKSFSKASMLMARMREVIFWSSFLGLIALIAVAFYVSAKITKPIEELTEFAKRIKQNDLPEKTNVRSPDEVGDLADALNEIVDSLSAANMRLSRLENMRKEFFANVRDEMELPAEIIQKQLRQLLQEKDITCQKAQDNLKRAIALSGNLQRVIHSLIEISQLEYGEISLEFKSFRLHELIDAFKAEFTVDVAQKNLRFEIVSPPELEQICVIGDKSLLHLVLRNLASNALDFTDSGFIKIICCDEGSEVKISVEDSGCGIPKDQIDRIFERFYKVVSPETSDSERTGLGLAIAKHIIDAHDQKIAAESTFGVGSRFSFWLKKAPEDVS